MIEDLTEYEYDSIQGMGYMIYEEIGRKQNGDGTWSKVHKEDGKFIVTGTSYSGSNYEKKEFRNVYDNLEDFKSGTTIQL